MASSNRLAEALGRQPNVQRMDIQRSKPFEAASSSRRDQYRDDHHGARNVQQPRYEKPSGSTRRTVSMNPIPQRQSGYEAHAKGGESQVHKQRIVTDGTLFDKSGANVIKFHFNDDVRRIHEAMQRMGCTAEMEDHKKGSAASGANGRRAVRLFMETGAMGIYPDVAKPHLRAQGHKGLRPDDLIPGARIAQSTHQNLMQSKQLVMARRNHGRCNAEGLIHMEMDKESRCASRCTRSATVWGSALSRPVRGH